MMEFYEKFYQELKKYEINIETLTELATTVRKCQNEIQSRFREMNKVDPLNTQLLQLIDIYSQLYLAATDKKASLATL
jgi:hypothetical protein